MKSLKNEIKWAIIFTLATIIWMIIEKSLGWHDEKIADHPIYTNIFAVVAISIYVFALLDKKRSFYQGQMTYKQGFVSGLIMTLFITLLSPGTQYIVHKWVSKDYFPNVIEYAVSSWEMTQVEAEAYFNLSSYMLQATIGAAIMGVITAAVVAVFVRSKK